MKALVGAFNQEKALVGAFSVIVQLRLLIVYSTRPGAARKQSGVPQWGTGGSGGTSRLLYFISQPPAASHLRSRDATSQNRGTTEYSATLLGSYQYEIFITFSCNPFSKNQLLARGDWQSQSLEQAAS